MPPPMPWCRELALADEQQANAALSLHCGAKNHKNSAYHSHHVGHAWHTLNHAHWVVGHCLAFKDKECFGGHLAAVEGHLEACFYLYSPFQSERQESENIIGGSNESGSCADEQNGMTCWYNHDAGTTRQRQKLVLCSNFSVDSSAQREARAGPTLVRRRVW